MASKLIKIEVTRYELLLLITAMISGQFQVEDQKSAYELAVKLKALS